MVAFAEIRGYRGKVRTHQRGGLRVEADRGAGDRLDLVGGAVEVVVDDAVVEVALLGELAFRRLEPAVDRLGGVGAAAAEALAEDRLVGRGDEDLDRVGAGRADLGRSLGLDLEDDGAALFAAAVEL